MTQTLLSIGQDAQALDALIIEHAEANEGDLTGVAAFIDDWLLENKTNLVEKLEGYGQVIREYQATAAARKVEAKRILELAQVDENHAQQLKDRLKWFFEAQEIDKIETATAKFSLVKNGGVLPLIIDENTNPEEVDEEYQKVTVSFDNALIRDALKDEKELAFAHFGERGKSLRIK